MGYYCTVPQCTSLAGKTKNVKFHRFPRDDTLAHKWNEILHRNKPFTKYSKVCSLHFTQADYNVTSMGQWKTLSKDAIPSQNLPKLNSDGSVMVIRKSRTPKSKLQSALTRDMKDDISERRADWGLASSCSSYSSSPGHAQPAPQPLVPADPSKVCVAGAGGLPSGGEEGAHRVTKHDAIMQTDPLAITSAQQVPQTDEGTSPQEAYSELSEPFPGQYEKQPKNYSKEISEEYDKIPHGYALERGKQPDFQQEYYKEKPVDQYYKVPIEYSLSKQESFDRSSSESQEYGQGYSKEYFDPAEVLRQHGAPHERPDDRFYAGRIKEEAGNEEDGFAYDTHKENTYAAQLLQQQRLMDMYERRAHIKTEPDQLQNCEGSMQNQHVGVQEYYRGEQHQTAATNGYYARREEEAQSQPGAELLKAKQNALAATLWQNSLKRPFYYSESPNAQINNSLLHSRYEFQDVNRLMNP